MTPENIRAWWETAIRDILLFALGATMLLYETVATKSPSTLIVGAGATLVGTPLVLHLDELRGKTKKGGHGE